MTKRGRPSAGPGREGRFEIGERTVPDPLEPGKRYAAQVNVRESAIAHMASRGRINAAEEEAGERFRRYWEKAAIGRARGIDPAKECVDGGFGPADPLTDDLVHAARELNRAMQATGMVGSRILQLIVEFGSVEAAADAWQRQGGILKGRRAEGYITGTLVDALRALVSLWRLEALGKPALMQAHYKRAGVKIPVKDDIRGSGPVCVTGPSREITVGRFGDVDVVEVRPREYGKPRSASDGSAAPSLRKAKRRG